MTLPTKMMIDPNAIDEASIKLFGYWLSTREDHEGLYSWLCRVAGIVRDFGQPGQGSRRGKLVFPGIYLIFDGERLMHCGRIGKRRRRSAKKFIRAMREHWEMPDDTRHRR